MIDRRRRRIGALVPVALLCALLVPSAHAASLAERAYALSNGTLLAFDPAAPGTVSSTPIVGVTAGETLVGIDVRPQNGMLYGLGVNATSDTATLYALSPETGFAGIVSSAAGAIALTTNGSIVVDLPNAGYGFDVNPATDRIRVTSAQGLNFRVNPNTGGAVDGDNTGVSSGLVSGTNPDGPIVNTGSTVDGTAFTNNRQSNGGVTTLYTLSATSDQLAIQNLPNAGTQTAAKDVTLAGFPLNFAAVGGFDVDASVDASTSNAAVPSGSGYAALTVGSANRLYKIDLVSGAATDLGTIGDGTAAIQGLALQRDLADAGYPLIALTADRASLAHLQTAAPGTSSTVALGALTAGETMAAIAWRPQTGQLYGLGVNATANTATLYLIDPQTGAVTAIGSPGQVAFVDGVGTPIDLPALSVGWGLDVNPAVDRIRVVAGSGLNFRVNQNTGGPVDGDAVAPGTNPDGSHNGLDAGATGVTAVAYTNAFGQTLIGAPTTLYVLEPTANKLYIQNPANSGTLTTGAVVTAGGAPLDFGPIAGLDLPPEVRVASLGIAATGTGIALLQVGGVSGIYSLDLATAAATLQGTVPAGLASIAIGRAWPAAPVVVPDPGTPAPPVIGPIKDVKPPKVTKLTLTSAKRKRVTITFTTNEAGRATIKVLREVTGRRQGKACKAKATTGKRCTIRTTYGTVVKSLSKAGKVTVKLEGKVGRKALKAGGLRIEITVRDAAGNRSVKVVKSGVVKA